MNEPMPNQPRDTYRPAKAQRRWADRATEQTKTQTGRHKNGQTDRQACRHTHRRKKVKVLISQGVFFY